MKQICLPVQLCMGGQGNIMGKEGNIHKTDRQTEVNWSVKIQSQG